MISFQNVVNVYQTFERASIYQVACNSLDLMTISRAHFSLQKRLRLGEEDLLDAVNTLRQIRWRLATNILPPSHADLMIDALAYELKSQAAHSDSKSEAGKIFDSVQRSVDNLLRIDRTPLSISVFEILSDVPESDRSLALAAGRYVASTEAYLEQLGIRTRVMNESQLRHHPIQECLVCVGPSKFFNTAVWHSPRAETTCFVFYSLGRPEDREPGLFGELGGLVPPRFRLVGETEYAQDEDIQIERPSEIYLATAERALRNYTREVSEGVEAVLLLLENSFAVWISDSDGSWNWTIDVSDESQPVITHSQSQQIDAGSFIIFREEGATSELIQNLADRNYGAVGLRSLQDKWKAALHKSAENAGGFSALDSLIRGAGAKAAASRDWSSRNAVRPNRLEDFKAACRVLGLERESSDIWNALSGIKSAHQRAGFNVRQQLEEALLEKGVADLRNQGYEKLQVSGLGTLSVYCVTHKHPTRHIVDRTNLDKPFETED